MWETIKMNRNTRLLSSMSALLPIKILFTLSEACCSIFLIQFLISVKNNNMISWGNQLYWSIEWSWRIHTVERRLVSNIIDEQNAHCSPVVGCIVKSLQFQNIFTTNSSKTNLVPLHSKGGILRTSCNSSETFLASSIPDLQLYALTIKFNCSYFEVDPFWRIKQKVF